MTARRIALVLAVCCMAFIAPSVASASGTRVCHNEEWKHFEVVYGSLVVEGKCETQGIDVRGNLLVKGHLEDWADSTVSGHVSVEAGGEIGEGGPYWALAVHGYVKLDGGGLEVESLSASTIKAENAYIRVLDVSGNMTLKNTSLTLAADESCAQVEGSVTVHGGSVEAYCARMDNLSAHGTNVNLVRESGSEGNVVGNIVVIGGRARLENLEAQSIRLIHDTFVTVAGNRAESITLKNNSAAEPRQMVVAGNKVTGSISCTKNVPTPIDETNWDGPWRELPNEAAELLGQCVAL